MRRVVWSAAALRDVEAHVAYLDQYNPQAARALAEALVTAGDSLATLPLRGRRGRIAGTRELVALHPYVIIYQVSRGAVGILRVWHGAQLA